MELVTGLIVLTILLLQLRKTIAPGLVSPVYVLVSAYVIIFSLGTFLYDAGYGGGGVVIDATTRELVQTAADVSWILSAFIAGVLFYAACSRKRAILRRPWSSLRGLTLTRFQALCGIALGIVTILVTVIGVGPENLWRRHEYLLFRLRIATIAAEVLSVASAFVMGILVTQRWSWCRYAARLIQAVVVVLMAAIATRRFAVALLLFCMGRVIAVPRNRHYRRVLAASVLATPFLLLIPLVSRQMPEQGLSTLHRIPAKLADLDWGPETHMIANNVLISAPITQVSAMPIHAHAMSYVWVSLNPMPGVMTDFYAQQLRLRLNAATPSNAMGDLLRAGLWVAMLYYFVVGAYFCHLELQFKSSQHMTAGMLMLIAISLFFTLISLQYPLRSITRFLYYMFVIDFGGQAIRAMFGGGSHRVRHKLRGRRSAALAPPGGDLANDSPSS